MRVSKGGPTANFSQHIKLPVLSYLTIKGLTGSFTQDNLKTAAPSEFYSEQS
jgi:hypothetical protein